MKSDGFDSQAFEDGYRFRKDYRGQSITAYVSANAEELAGAFLSWKQEGPPMNEPLSDTLAYWEEERFTKPLPPASHGILLSTIASRKAGPEENADLAKANPRRPGEKDSEYLLRLARVLNPEAAAEPVQSMPDAGVVKPIPVEAFKASDKDVDWLETDDERDAGRDRDPGRA